MQSYRTERPKPVKPAALVYPPPPFPQRLVKQQSVVQHSSILIVLRKLAISETYAEALMNNPSFERFKREVLAK